MVPPNASKKPLHTSISLNEPFCKSFAIFNGLIGLVYVMANFMNKHVIDVKAVECIKC